jgi:hypothetical protein
LADHAHIANKVLPPSAQSRVGRERLDAVEIWTGTNNKYPFSWHPPTFYRDTAIESFELGDVCSLKVSLSAHNLPQNATLAKFGFIELRICVVLIEDELCAGENLKEETDEENEIWWIAAMDHVKAVTTPDFE